MSTTTELLYRHDYLLVKVIVPWTKENAIQAIDEAKTEATRQGYKRILFDLTKWSGPDSEMTRFYSGEYLARTLAYRFKTAAFAPPESINKFGENTAVNRGAWFRIFPDEASAINWLMEEANQSSESEATSKPGAPQ